jgi:signal transduction histidine kinase
LTLLFAVLITFFLIAFNLIGYYLLSSSLYHDREEEIIHLADEEAAEHSGKLLGIPAAAPAGKLAELPADDYRERIRNPMDKPALQSFYLVLDRNGEPVSGSESWGRLQESVRQYLRGWIPEPGETRTQAFPSGSQTVNLIFAGKAVYQNGVFIGCVYAGADITQQTEVLHQYMLLLSGMSVCFLIVSALLGYFMSGRAMVPIIRSFAKQQQFTGDASHELRTPLSVIQASLDVIASDEETRLSPFGSQVLADVRDEVRRMSRLVTDLLTLARADSAEIQLQPELFPIREEIVKLVRKMQPVAAGKQLKLRMEAEPDLLLRADRGRLVQLLLILLDNAIQYTEEPGEIVISASRKGKMLQLSVADPGKGIPESEQKEIFERFYRGDKSRARSEGHAGLGLAIAEWIVRAHKGAIRVASSPGRGSTFTVLLPVVDPR